MKSADDNLQPDISKLIVDCNSNHPTDLTTVVIEEL